jgi:hypothetical protein
MSDRCLGLKKKITSLMQPFLNICSTLFEIFFNNFSLGASINILNILNF